MNLTELVGQADEAMICRAVGARLTLPPHEEKQRKSTQIDSRDWDDPATAAQHGHSSVGAAAPADQTGGTPHVTVDLN